MCEKCEAIRDLLLQAVVQSAALVAERGAPPDFDGWLEANPDACDDLRIAAIPYELAQAAWLRGYIAGRLFAELGLPRPDSAPVPNMPAADA
jgi:hypothetical protein